MTLHIRDIIRRGSRPLEPKPTDVTPILRFLPGIKALLFDVYGTLVVSESRDRTTETNACLGDAFTIVMKSMEVPYYADGSAGASKLLEVIERHHNLARQRGVDFPEVDIVKIWHEALTDLSRTGSVDVPVNLNIERLAVEYELLINPVWPMPGAAESMRELRTAGLCVGIVSNAQFFTPEIFPAVFNASLDSLGCSDDLRFFSYRHGRAKPDQLLFRLARNSLARREIKPHETLYVGNDMLNDILPATQTGFRTGLFAGDARSLRLRRYEPRVAGIRPDLVLTHLSQVEKCIVVSLQAVEFVSRRE